MPKITLRWATAPHEKAPLLCRLFGHHWEGGWFGDRPYFRQEFKAIDNLNTFHVKLTCECDRCGATTPVGYTHHRSKSSIIGRPYPE
jgi:hypothetical protein